MSTKSMTDGISNIGTSLWDGLGTGIATTLFNGTLGMISNKQNYDNSVALWKMNNAYNTPAEQMKRLEEAGLNPNLVYGTGTVTGNTSSQPSAPTLQVPRFAIDYTRAMLGKNLEKMDEEIKSVRENNKYLREQIRGLTYNNDLFVGSGLPLNSPWYAKALNNLAYEWTTNPEKVNILKGLGNDLYDLIHPTITFPNLLNPGENGKDIIGNDLPDWYYKKLAEKKYH